MSGVHPALSYLAGPSEESTDLVKAASKCLLLEKTRAQPLGDWGRKGLSLKAFMMSLRVAFWPSKDSRVGKGHYSRIPLKQARENNSKEKGPFCVCESSLISSVSWPRVLLS